MGCIFYRGVYGNIQECPKRGSPRYKQVGCTRPYKKITSLSDHTMFDTILSLIGHIQTIGMASREQKHEWSRLTCGGF
jgi:hypothetical protein